MACYGENCFSCISSKYLKVNRCEPCQSNCKTCTDGVGCTSCVKGFFFSEAGSLCLPCDEGCLDCNSQGHCLACIEGTYVTGGLCKKCGVCETCTSLEECSSCRKGYYFE